MLKVSTKIPEITWRWDERNLDLHFKSFINFSFIAVHCEFEGEYQEEYFDELYKRSFDLARAAVNLVAFATGYGLTVILENVIRPDGTPSVITLQDEALVSHCTAFSLTPQRTPDFEAVMQIVMTEPAIFRLLNDLIESITLPHIAPVNCGRVIDGINRLISPRRGRKVAWPLMQQALNLSQAFLEPISELAKGPRHGDMAFIPGNKANEITRRTWIIMNRFLEYRKRGNHQLKAPEFPNL